MRGRRGFLLEVQHHAELLALWALRACLHGGGGPQVGEVTRLAGVTHLSI